MSDRSKEMKIDQLLRKSAELIERLGRLEHLLIDLQIKKSEKEATKVEPNRERWPIRYLEQLKKWTAFLLSLVAVVTSYVALRYDVSVTSLVSLDSSYPFATRFLVSNDGPFGVYNVRYECLSTHVHSRMDGVEGPEMKVENDVPLPLGNLRAHGQYSVRCQFPLPSRPERQFEDGAVMEVKVSYSPSNYLPWYVKSGGQIFILEHDRGGNWVWLPAGGFVSNREELDEYHFVPDGGPAVNRIVTK